ncbi:hypothetical protein LUZ60_016509 [Juncus effusus]|nr:hypothetical protein LUZ60_016509 [Juncus effusus]
MRDLHLTLNQTQRVRLQAALDKLESLAAPTAAAAASVTVADTIPVNHEDNILKGHGTSELDGEVVATLCGVVERVNKLVYVRALRSRYKPEVGDIIVGRVIEIAPKRWRLEINFCQDAVLMLSSMNLPDGIQRRRTAVDELNMRSIFVENDVICAEVRGFQHDGSLHLQARSQKYGKLEKGQLLTVAAYLIKRRKQHFHHLEEFNVDLILGCNGFIWIGQHTETNNITNISDDNNINNISDEFMELETRRNICRIANAVRLLAVLGLTLTLEAVLETVKASVDADVAIGEMLGAEFYVMTVEREAERRASVSRKKGY